MWFALWIWACSVAWARSWAVDVAGGDFTSISEAIAAAADGDTVLVGAGTWTETVDFLGKDIDVIGVGAVATTVQPPPGVVAVRMIAVVGGRLEGCTLRPVGARGVEIDGGSPVIVQVDVEGAGTDMLEGGALRVLGDALVVLEDVEIRSPVALRGGGLYVGAGATAVLDGVVVRDAVATWGGGLYATGATVLGASFEVNGSWSDYAGSGAYVQDSAVDLDVIEIVDANTDLGSGAGMLLLDGSSLVARGGRFEGNAPLGAGEMTGGGLRAEASTIELTGVVWEGNEAWSGGAMALDRAASATLTDVVFDGNVATDAGGAVSLSGASTLDCLRCTWHANEATDGGAAFAGDDVRLTDVDGDWSGNVASDRGGALRGDESLEISFDGTVLDGNQAGGSGGALSVDELFLPLLLLDVRAEGNRAEDGDGGVLSAGADCSVVATDGRYVDNDAEVGSGGAFSFEPGLGSIADLIVVGAEFEGNGAGQRGGAIDAWRGGLVSMDSVTWVDGSAGEHGGALCARDVADVVVLRSAAHGNVAVGAGGAVYVEDVVGATTLTSTLWTENEADDGGAVASEGGALDVVNNTFLANVANAEGGHVRVADGTLAFVNNIAAWAVDGGGLWADAASAAAADTYYNDVLGNGGGDWVGSLVDPGADSGNLVLDPLLRAWSPNGLFDDDLHLVAGSPCIDAGEPTLFDLDGSRSDIGAYGGPWADVADFDADGWLDHVDCDDQDPARNPGATELPYDGVDQDCDGWDLLDLDGDGFFGGIGGNDCDDADPAVYEGAPDAWYDGTDADCAGNSDFDQDADGTDADTFGGTDCDDVDPLVSPAALETWYDGADGDCSGGSDYDQDADARDAVAYGGEDCDDLDAAVFPGAVEHCDGVDDDCDGVVDEDAVDPTAWFVDLDADAWGLADLWLVGCSQPPGTSAAAGDCDDGDPLVFPGAEEHWYDGIDQDCDGRDDDRDADGWPIASDCDDGRAEAYPGAPEQRNGLDDDCDGLAEDFDSDSDGLIDWDEWNIGTDALDPDTDRDSVLDGEEVPDPAVVADTDGDGLIDPMDTDDDDDDIPTRHESTVDPDLDGVAEPDVDGDEVPNRLDGDTDGDGLPDVDEGEDDLDRDDVPDYADFTGGLAGGGCAGGGGGSAWFALPLLGLRRRGRTMILALWPAAASAQGVDGHGLELFGSSSSGFTRVLPVATGGAMEVDAGLIVDQASRPVVEILPDERVALLHQLTTANFVAAFHPTARVRIDVAAPVHIAGIDAGGIFAGPGDLRLGAALGLVEPSGWRPGVLVEPTVWLPTGADGRNVGVADPGGGLVASVGHDTARFGWSLNAGYRVGPTREVRNLVVGAGPLFGAGVRVSPRPDLALVAELTAHGATGISDAPVEATGFVRGRGSKGRWWLAGGGAGLTDGVGAASWRLLVGTGFGRPPPALPTPEPVIVHDIVEVPVVDPDQVASPALPPPLVELVDNRIVLHENLFFREGSHELLAQSEPVLHAIRQVLVDRPDIEYLLVQGHTNRNGSANFNLMLSENRSRAVCNWLIVHQVDRSRLLFKGYGFDEPLVPHGHADAARLNRRVEFLVLRPDELPGDARVPEDPRLLPDR